MKRDHDYGSVLKKAFNQGFPYSFRQEAWQQADRHGIEEVSESLHPDLQVGSRERLSIV